MAVIIFLTMETNILTVHFHHRRQCHQHPFIFFHFFLFRFFFVALPFSCIYLNILFNSVTLSPSHPHWHHRTWRRGACLFNCHSLILIKFMLIYSTRAKVRPTPCRGPGARCWFIFIFSLFLSCCWLASWHCFNLSLFLSRFVNFVTFDWRGVSSGEAHEKQPVQQCCQPNSLLEHQQQHRAQHKTDVLGRVASRMWFDLIKF